MLLMSAMLRSPPATAMYSGTGMYRIAGSVPDEYTSRHRPSRSGSTSANAVCYEWPSFMLSCTHRAHGDMFNIAPQGLKAHYRKRMQLAAGSTRGQGAAAQVLHIDNVVIDSVRITTAMMLCLLSRLVPFLRASCNICEVGPHPVAALVREAQCPPMQLARQERAADPPAAVRDLFAPS